MAITNKQILQKVIIECENGIKNEKHIREHAKAIQSLTDLLLEQDVKEEKTSVSTIDEVEWNKMMGANSKQQTPSINKVQKSDDQSANGDSLLDF